MLQVPPEHEPPSHIAALVHEVALVLHVPAVEPAPEPQAAPPSQSALTRQAVLLVPQVPPVHEPLSQVAAL